jgi:LemA protein
MKKYIAIATVVLLMIVSWGKFNDLASSNEDVKIYFGRVQIALQSQADVIPNLVETTKGYMSHEQKVFIETAKARAGATSKFDLGSLANDPEKLKQFKESQAAMQQAMQTALVAVNAIKESNPDPKAIKQVEALTRTITTENGKVSFARKQLQDEVAKFNKKIVTFPSNLFSRIAGYTTYPFFEADADAKVAPKVKF